MKKKKSVSSARDKQVVKYIPDSEIDFSDIPEMTPEEIKCGLSSGNPKSGKPIMKKNKMLVTKTASELSDALGLSPADGVEIELRSDLNNKIISVVKSKGLTYAQVAKLAQASRTTVSALMSHNASDVSTDFMVRTLASLGVRAKLQFKMIDAHKEVISSHFFTIKELDEMIQKKFPKGISASEKIKALRIREGLTQKMLAERSQIARQNISEIERGERPVGVQTAKKLSAILNCDYRSIL